MNKINVGFIGCGRISDLHYPGYINNPSARVYAVCDTSQDLLEQRKKEWGAVKAYQNYQDLLQDKEVDAVEILSPQLLHEEMTIEAIKAGKHVALQKPMTIDLESADRILKVASSNETLFKVTDNYLFYPPIVYAKKLIEQGEIGTPTNLRIKMISGGSGGWAVPSSAWAWRAAENADGRGFETFDHGHHLWAVAWHLMGKVERVSAWIDSIDGVIDSPAVIMWKYDDGVKYGSCEYAHAPDMHIPSKYYANDEWFEITGTKGIIIVHRCTGNIHDGPIISMFNGHNWKTIDDVPSDWNEGFIGSTHNFVDAIKGSTDPLLTGEQAREILKFCLAISKSSRVRREVYLEELDAEIPWAYTKNRIREELKTKKAKKPGSQKGWQGDSIRPANRQEITQMMSGFVDSYDKDKALEWTTNIQVTITWENESPIIAAFKFNDGLLTLDFENPSSNPDLMIIVSAEIWSQILAGTKAIEEAFAMGELVFEGKIEEGLKLKEVLHL